MKENNSGLSMTHFSRAPLLSFCLLAQFSSDVRCSQDVPISDMESVSRKFVGERARDNNGTKAGRVPELRSRIGMSS